MKKNFTRMLLYCCASCTTLQTTAQIVTVKSGAVVTIKNSQTFPTLKNEGSIVLKDSTTLTLTGITSGIGTLSVGSKNTLIIAESSSGKVYFDPTQNTLKRLEVYGALTLGSPLNIAAGTGSVKLRHGTLYPDSLLILKSDLGGTASIDSSSGSILGPVIVERYIPAHRTWRFLAVPFESSTQSINRSWQEGYINTVLGCPPQYPGATGYGTHLTHNALNGYDKNVTNNPSIYKLERGQWDAPPSTFAKNITDYRAYAVFVRGDRTICLSQGTNALPVPTTLRASGRVSIGDLERTPEVVSGEYILEGNPYASSINVLPMTLRSSGIAPETFWIWDPGYSDYGGYIAYSAGVNAPITSNYPTPESVCVVQSGQGYMVQSIDSPQVLHYEEKDKTSINSSSVFARPQRSSVVHIQLLSDNLWIYDGVAARFVDGDTMYKSTAKLWNFQGSSIALARGELLYGIETRRTRPLDTSYMYFKNMNGVAYVLEIFHSYDARVRLIDNLLGREIDVVDTLRYQFTVFDSTSYTDRFRVVYGDDEAILPEQLFAIYPNPVGHMLYIKGVNGPIESIVTDVIGRVLIVSRTAMVDCSALKPGMYFVTINKKTYSFQK